MQADGRIPKPLIATIFVCLLGAVLFSSKAWRDANSPQLALSSEVDTIHQDSSVFNQRRSLAAIPILEANSDSFPYAGEAIPADDRTMARKGDAADASQPLLRPVAAMVTDDEVPQANQEPQESSPSDIVVEKPVEPATQTQPDAVVVQQPLEELSAEVEPVWPLPQSLITQIEPLLEKPNCRNWAQAVMDEVQQLHATTALTSPEAERSLHRLRELAAGVTGLLQQAADIAERAELLRAQYALVRRLDIWQQVQRAAQRTVSLEKTVSRDPRLIAASLDAIEKKLSVLRYHEAWRQYLLLDQAAQVFFGDAVSLNNRRKIAQSILLRLENPAFNETQHAFFTSPEFVRWRTQLLDWAMEPVDYAALIQQVEEYEGRQKVSVAQHVSHNAQILRWSKDESQQQLGKLIDTHYRNANVRISISGELLNRYLPEPQEFTGAVRDRISGAAVRGTSRTRNQLFVKLIPDRYRIRMGLEAHGVVRSETGAYSGPVVFWNRGLTRLQARKLILLEPRGFKVRRAEAWASSSNQVRGLQTDYDGVPIIGNIVRSTAMDEQRNRAGQAKREVEAKVEREARTRLDEEVHAKLAKAEANFQANILGPLQKLRLNPQAIGLSTTADRIAVRARLAGHTQLASFTPRPQARSDSLVSVQIHQSALNNFVQQLDLDGGTFELQELVQQIAATLYLKDTSFADDFPEDVTIQFAKENAIRFDFVNGRLGVTMRIVKLSAGRRSWKSFAVRTYYQPTIAGRDATFARDPESYIELVGKRLRLGDQIALRAVFSKVFSANQSWSVMPEKFTQEPRLEDLVISQFVMSDGWIGISLTPQRPVEQARARLGERLKSWR